MNVIELSPDRPRRSTGPRTGNAVILVLPDLKPVKRLRVTIPTLGVDQYVQISEDAERLVRRSINLLRSPKGGGLCRIGGRMVKSRNIDGFGRKQDRRGVALIQRLQGSSARKAAAQAKRDRRNAKRASKSE